MGLHAAIIRLSPLIHEGEQRYKPYIVGDPRMVFLSVTPPFEKSWLRPWSVHLIQVAFGNNRNDHFDQVLFRCSPPLDRSVRLIQGVYLIWCPLNAGFTAPRWSSSLIGCTSFICSKRSRAYYWFEDNRHFRHRVCHIMEFVTHTSVHPHFHLFSISFEYHFTFPHFTPQFFLSASTFISFLSNIIISTLNRYSKLVKTGLTWPVKVCVFWCIYYFAFSDAVLWFVILFSWLLVYNVDVPAKGRVYNQGRVLTSYISQA